MTKANIGCGPIYMDGWVNIDISSHHRTDICGDILQLHIDDNTFDVILSTHMFEHLAYPVDAVECLNRFYRWLKPGGIFRLAVPDLERAANAYSAGSNLKFLYGGDFKGYYYKDTPCERFNFFVKAWEHQMCYDYNLLRELLKDAGFNIIEKREANVTHIPNFNHDRFISESLYVEAVK